MSNGSPRIGLCLSGGGFRATFFHLGVIRYLYEADLLKNVILICSVSGESILAAHLLQHWHYYTGSSDDFTREAKQLAKFAQFDLRGRIVRRWLISVVIFPIRLLTRRFWKRTLLLQKYYSDHLYRGESLKVLGPSSSNWG
jgi:hypothetical protein